MTEENQRGIWIPLPPLGQELVITVREIETKAADWRLSPRPVLVPVEKKKDRRPRCRECGCFVARTCEHLTCDRCLLKD